ncbi:MAG: NAD-dependent epimerase/dehydratase family protein [Ginsengibacter sp.]
MIVGRGLLAKALREIDQDSYLFYVNGISNSVIENIGEDNFEMNEITAIARKNYGKTFVYFSTIQLNSKDNYQRPYVIHKIKMEELVKRLFPDYVIIRTSNIIGNNPWNTHTLFNYLYNSLTEGEKISVIDSASRNILDVDHFIKLTNHYLTHYKKQPATVNIVNSRSYRMVEIVSTFEKLFESKFVKDNIPVVIAKFEAPCLFSAKLMQECGIESDNYLADVVKKYYPIFKRDQPA